MLSVYKSRNVKSLEMFVISATLDRELPSLLLTKQLMTHRRVEVEVEVEAPGKPTNYIK